MKINEIEFIYLGDKIRTLLKKKNFNLDDITILLNKNPNKRKVHATQYTQKMYMIIKERIINKYNYSEIRSILLFYAFFTNTNIEIINDYSLINIIIKNFNSFINYKSNMVEYFLLEFFNNYKIKDMKTFLKDNIYEYGLLRDLMDNKISLIQFLILDEMFGFSIYMNKQDIVYWKKYCNKISNIKKFFKIDRKQKGFGILYTKLKKKLEIEFKIDLDNAIEKNRIFIKEV